jgi:hypothetical protein
VFSRHWGPGQSLQADAADYFITRDLPLAVLDVVMTNAAVNLTFDDGYASGLEIALPALPCAAASDERVTLVPGIEYGDDDVHVPVWGRVPFFGDTLRIGDLLQQVSQLHGTAVWAHSWRRDAWRRFDPSWQEHLAAIEVGNRKYDGVAPNRRSVELSECMEAQAFVSLDFHTRRQLFVHSLALQLDHDASEGRTPAPEPLIFLDDVCADLHARRFPPRARTAPRLPDGRLARRGLANLESGRRIAARLEN